MIARGTDLTPLAERLGLLQAGRVAAALAVLGIPALTGDAPDSLVPLAIAFVGLTAVLELIRWRARVRALHLVSAMLLLDALFLAAATTLTGGPSSPLLFLMFLDVLAVTLLASYRSGLKIAIWCALLLFLGQAAIHAGVITSARPAGDRDIALGAAAFLVVAIAAAVFSAVNERALRESRGHLSALVDLDANLARAASAHDVGRVLARYARGHLGFRRAAVITSAGDGWVAVVAPPDGYEIVAGPCHAPTDSDLVPSGDRWRLVKALEAGTTLATALPEARGVVVVPMDADGAHLGVVAAEWTGDDRMRIPALTVRSLAQAAGHAALSLRHLALLAEVEALATTDPLTGIANRRVFDEELDRELHRSRRLDEPVTVVLVDADRFKRINDERGHLVGDAVLRAIAQALRSNTKAFDVIARLGGDEFT
ncbi:MAG TPA: diguanylate cyclase, partial [Solirubrobacteraceae bacterium]